MTYDFFANAEDKIKLLNFIFDETDLRIFDCYSRPEESLAEYENTKAIVDTFDLKHGGEYSVTFNLWSSRFSEQIHIEKIKLDPKYCKGKTFRFLSSGCGLIQLYFGGLEKGRLNKSHIGHQSEKRAIKWEHILNNGDRADKWNWREIARTSRRLRDVINKMSVDKIAGLGIMDGAKKLEDQGIRLGRFIR